MVSASAEHRGERGGGVLLIEINGKTGKIEYINIDELPYHQNKPSRVTTEQFFEYWNSEIGELSI